MQTANIRATPNLTQRLFDFLLQTLGLDPAACGPPASVTRSSDTFENYVYTIRITHEFKRLGIQITIFFSTDDPRTSPQTVWLFAIKSLDVLL